MGSHLADLFSTHNRSMKDWLIWIYYINPVNYAFSALMGNEFGRISLYVELISPIFVIQVCNIQFVSELAQAILLPRVVQAFQKILVRIKHVLC